MNLIFPALVFYTDNLPENKAGVANAFVIRIRPKYKTDKGLLQHELVHVKQWFRTFTLHSPLYMFSKSYRLKAELEAYREQLKYYEDDRTEMFAGFICNDYDLNVDKNTVIGMLKNGS